MRLFELQSKEIEQQLQGISQGISDGSLAPPPPAGAEPMPGPGDNIPPPPPEDADPLADMDPVEPELLAAVKSHPYVANYNHDEEKPTHPMRLLGLSAKGLEQARTAVTTKMGLTTLSNKVGLYDDPGMKFYIDLMSFIDRVLQHKKQNSHTAPMSKGASAEKQPAPKTNQM